MSLLTEKQRQAIISRFADLNTQAQALVQSATTLQGELVSLKEQAVETGAFTDVEVAEIQSSIDVVQAAVEAAGA